MITKNIEKEFKIEIIASIIENKLLIEIPEYIEKDNTNNFMNYFIKELFEFCSFITGETVNFSNIDRLAPTIKNLLYKEYPKMNKVLTNQYDYYQMTNKEIKDIINIYKETYGEKIKIKSRKKVIVKSLKL